MSDQELLEPHTQGNPRLESRLADAGKAALYFSTASRSLLLATRFIRIPTAATPKPEKNKGELNSGLKAAYPIMKPPAKDGTTEAYIQFRLADTSARASGYLPITSCMLPTRSDFPFCLYYSVPRKFFSTSTGTPSFILTGKKAWAEAASSTTRNIPRTRNSFCRV